jgi:hypothetical protein
LILATLVISVTILFLPFLGEVWVNAEIRFLIFLGLLGLVAIMLIRWTLPQRSEYEVMPPLEEPPRLENEEGTMVEQALDGYPFDQLKMYLELRTVFLDRLRSRRHLDDLSWRTLISDQSRLQAVVGDQDLLLLTYLQDWGTADLAQYNQIGLSFGTGFMDRFGTLLGKVEQWT